MNEYDDLIANPSQPAPGQSARVGFSVALDANPDEYAEARRVAQRTGVPVDTALNMPKEIKKRARMGEIDFDSMAVTSPATAKLLADIDLAKMSHDDVDNLSGFEQAARFLKNSGKALASGVPKFNEGMWGVLQAGGEALPSLVGDPIAGFAKEQRGYSKYNADQLLGKADGNLEAGWNSGLQSLGNNLLQLPLAIFGGATPLLTSMGLSTGGGAYGQARDQGLDRGRAFSFGATQGMIEVGTEMIGMPALLSMLKPGAFGKKALEYLYKDQFGEQIATHTQDLNEWASLPENKDKTFSDYLAERPDAAIQTAIATAVGGGGQVAVMKAIEAVVNRGAQREQEAQQAGQMGELLTGMTKLAEASKLRERDVETAQGFFQSVLDEGRDSVFITPEALAQSGLAEQIAQAIPAVAEQMQTASESGHDIRLPIAELMATMAGPELAQSIIPHVAVDPGGFTATTAQEYMQSDKAAELQAEVEKILGEKQVDDTFKASAEIVKSRIISELTATTRWDAAKNEADATIYSAYYAVRAAQLGVTPETLYDQRRVNFSDVLVDGQQYDQTGKLVTDTPNFKNWFGESKVVDESGKPIVVYHGTKNDFSIFFPDSHFGTKDQADSILSEKRGKIGKQVMPVYLSIQKMKRVKDQEIAQRWADVVATAKRQGYDGLIYKNEFEGDGTQDSYVVFKPEQIKSATGNNGQFDANDPNILHQSAKNVEGSTDRVVDMFGNGNRVQYFNDKKGIFIESQKYPTGKVKWRAGEVIDGLNQWFSAEEFDSKEAAEKSIRGYRAKERSAQKYGDIPNMWRGEEKKVSKAIIDAGLAIDRFSSSTQSKSKYIYLENGLKIRLSDHSLPIHYDAPDIDFRYGDNIKALIGEIKKSSEGAPAPNSATTKLPGAPDAGTQAPTSAGDVTQEMARAILDGTSDIPDGWYVHGRARSEKLTDEWPIQMTQSVDIASGYAGNSGSVWMIKPKSGSVVADFSSSDSADMDKFISNLRSVYADQMESEEGQVYDLVSELNTGEEIDFEKLEEYVRDEFTPAKIVDSAQAFDNDMWINLLQYFNGTRNGWPDFVVVPSGAVVMPGMYSETENVNLTKLSNEPSASAGSDVLNQSQNGTVALDPLAVERLYKFLVAEPLVDGASLDTKNLANVLEGVTGLSEPERVSGLESLSRVLGHVRVGILHDSQILDSIVELIPVDVVDNLFGSKDAAKVALHDEAMLKDASAFNAELLVSGGGNGSSPVSLHIRDIALLSAKMLEAGSPLYSRRESAKGLPAKVAGEGDALWHDKGTPRAKFNPSTLTVTLLSGADFTSSLHEGAHFFFENDIFLASNILADADIHGYDTLSVGEKQILLDVSKLMDWHGIQGNVTEQLRQWANMDFEEKRTYHERTAESFERYLFEGKAPSIELQPYFQRFAAWWKNVYTSMKDFLAKNPEAGKLNPEIAAVFDRMLATTEQIQLAEQGRSMMPLFRTQAEAANIGMTPAEFEAYQHQDVDATNAAIEQLQARGLRDMQWIHNARGRVIKQLQKESAAKRAEVQMEARAEIMSQPVYRAWTFLTGKQTRDDLTDIEKTRADYREILKVWEDGRKVAETEARKVAKQEAWESSEEGQKKYRKEGSLTKAQQKVLNREEPAIEAAVDKALAEWEKRNRKPNDPEARPKSNPDVVDETIDPMFAAIAKLGGINKRELVTTWGIDPADTAKSGVFGKFVMRAEDKGLSIDGMAEALSQYGYLNLDENGKWDIRELEEKFKNELGGDPSYSNAYDYANDQNPNATITNPGGMTAGRVSMSGLSEVGLPAEVINALMARKMTAKEGLHPDQVAELFDFSSGDELARRLAAAETPKDAINGLTDQRMLERFGDLSSQEAIDKAADKAIHNEVRARMMATELNALENALGKRKTLAAAAKEYAVAMIGRVKVRDLKPGQYSSAEARAIKAAQQASKAGDIAKAAAEQRNALINNYATRAAHDAQDEVDAALRYLKKFDSAGVRKGLDADYTDQIDALLERFDLRKGQSLKAIDKRDSLVKWIEAQKALGNEPDISDKLADEAYRTSYKNLTVDEMRDVVETVKHIEHLGRLKRRLLTAKDQREFAAIVDEAEESIIENGGEAREVELESPSGIVPWLEGVAAGHRKFASLLRQMDGGKDGGPLWRILGRTMNESATAEAVMLEQATIQLAEIYKPILSMKGGTTGDLKFIPAINASLTRGGRLSVALNWGNETNRSRVMDGDKWTPAQVNAVLSTMTREEWVFVQNIWNHIDSYWPQISEKERRVSGKVPDKVKADAFAVTLADGSSMTLSGGYYPIKYDSNRDDRAEKHDAAAVADDMKRGAFTRATTRRGHTKERVENVKRPVRKTLDVITQHISEVAHDLSWHEWLIDANRLIDAKPINNAIREYYGTEVIRTMKDMLTAIATADIVPQTKIDQALLYLRANVSRSTMGLSLTTAFLQPFGLTQSMVRIGPKHVLRGMARWGGDLARFQSGTEWIKEKSDFMRLRSKTFNRELHEIKGRVSHGNSQARQIYDASLFMLMQKMQMIADVPTWIGAYEKAKAENYDEATAIALADQAVLDSQGGGQTKDTAEFQRKHPMLAMFYSYFNVTLNLAAESTAQTDFKNPMAVAGWMADMALLMVIPALGPAILLELMRGGDDDDGEEWAKKLAKWQAGYLMGTVIGVREASGLVSGFDYAGPPVGRVISDLGSLGKQIAQGEIDENLVLASVRLMGTATGIPTVQIIRSWRGWKAWDEGKAAPTAVLLGPPPKD